MNRPRNIITGLPLAGLSLLLAACSPADNNPPASQLPAADPVGSEHLDVIRDAEQRTEPEIDDYHRAAPEHKEDPGEAPPEVLPPGDPLPRLEGDPTPVPATGEAQDRPYRGEAAGSSRSGGPADGQPPIGG